MIGKPSHHFYKTASPPNTKPPTHNQAAHICRAFNPVPTLFAADIDNVGDAELPLLLLLLPDDCDAAVGDIVGGRTEIVFCDDVWTAALDVSVSGLMAVVIVLTVPPIVAVIVSVTGAVVSPVPALCVDTKVDDPDLTVRMKV